MIARGIVEKIYDERQVAVRLPIFDKSGTANSRTPTDSLGIASICVLPNSIPNVRVGDVVYVAFENGDIYKPVIIGYVYIDREYQTRQSLSLESLDVLVDVSLPQSTKIGNVTSTEISYLDGVTSPIQEQLDNLEEQIQQGGGGTGGDGGTGPIETVSSLDPSPTQDSPTFVIYDGQIYALVEE